MITEEQEPIEEVADKQNSYATNLAEVNKKNDVMATEDIFNENGLLVAKKGTRINNDTAERIVQHKLITPLEEQVKLENSLDGKKLSEGFNYLINNYEDLKQIHDVYEFQKTIDR